MAKKGRTKKKKSTVNASGNYTKPGSRANGLQERLKCWRKDIKPQEEGINNGAN